MQRHKVTVLAIFERYIEAETPEEASGTACNRVRNGAASAGLNANVVLPVLDSYAETLEALVSGLYADCEQRALV